MLLSVVLCSLCIAFAAANDPSEADINYEKNALLAEVVNYVNDLKPYAEVYKAAFADMAVALEAKDFNAIKVELGEVRNLASRLDYDSAVAQMSSVQDEFRRLSSRTARRVREAGDDEVRMEEFINKLNAAWTECSGDINDPRPQGCYLNVDGSSEGVYIDQGSDVCVKFEDTGLYWDDARAFCQNLGMDLATIDTQSKHDFIYSKFLNELSGPSDFNYWIGGHRGGGDNSFHWVSNDQPFTSGFTAWHSGEPNNSGNNEPCAHIWMAGNTWNDAPCNYHKKVVCHGELGFDTSA